ncbi:MAG TPA: chromate efflux transporter, partial [Anaeromyxobacter sp.]
MDDGPQKRAEAGTSRAQAPEERPASLSEVFWYFLKLGWLAFGGPIGQIGLMHLEMVERRKWIGEDEFVRALNFCHLLPGPEATQLAIYVGYKKAGPWAGILAGVLFILPGYVTLSVLAWIYVHYGKTPQVLGILWGFRPVGLALLLAALVRISRAALKGPFPVVLALAAFATFYFARLPFLLVLFGCGLAYIAWRRAGPGSRVAATAASLLVAVRAEAAESAANRLLDISWFFLKVGLFSFGGAYAVLPYIREGAVATYGWITDHQMIDALALGETTPGPLISIAVFVG